MKQNALVIYSKSIGDTLCATPTLRKLYNTYGSEFVVVTHVPELFLHNPCVSNIKEFDIYSEKELESKFNVFKTFHNMGKRNKEGIELKGALTDIRQIHAIDLGFTLLPEEMMCDFYPDPDTLEYELPNEYVCIHPVQTWPSRSWSKDAWLNLIEELNKIGITVVSVGKDSNETGFFDIDKPAFHIEHKNNIDLINKLNLSQTWDVINRAKSFITMDSGLLHLAGTTNTHIIMLGSSIHPKFRMPYRNGSQEYKTSYVNGPCGIFCASDMKYSLREWGNIQSVPPLIVCLENKPTFECHPNVQQVVDAIGKIINIEHIDTDKLPSPIEIGKKVYNLIELLDFSDETRTFNFSYKGDTVKKTDIFIKDDYTGLTYYHSQLELCPNINYFVSLNFKTPYNRRFEIYDTNTNELLYRYVDMNLGSVEKFDIDNILKNIKNEPKDAAAYPLMEIFGGQYYNKQCHVEENDVVVDVGSNIGLFSLYSMINKCKVCYAIEPHPITYSYLQKNVSGLNIITENTAISTLEKAYMPSEAKLSLTSPTFLLDPNSFSGCIPIKITTFSDFISKHSIKNIDFLKVDIEGGEFDLFNNIDREFLKNNIKKIVIEVHKFAGNPNDILNILNDFGFQCDYVENNTIFAWKKSNNKKLLFVTPHLSTGGLPQYLLKSVELLKNQFNVYVVEYENLTAGIFTVQKNRIIGMLPSENFITLNSNKNELLDIINRIQPDTIHLEEFPEIFMDFELAKKIYTNTNRTYNIIETTHNSAFKSSDKIFLPDKFCLVCKDSVDKFKDLNVPIELSEYPIERKERPNREEALKKLGLDPSYKHVLNVGLFTSGKNQGEIFEYAKSLINEKIQFHFVGNQAGNFQDYWLPLMNSKPNNCIVWGERSDVDDFYSSCDLFLFTSLSELNPIVLKEALSWQMPILMYNLPIYHDSYDSIVGVKYLTKDLNKNISIMLNSLGVEKTDIININEPFDEQAKSSYKIKLVHLLNFPNDSVEIKSIDNLSKLKEYGIDYIQHINPIPTEIPELSLYPNQQGGQPLFTGHYGCFAAFRRAILEEFTNDVDFLLICERDCVLTVTPLEFYNKMMKYCPIILKEDISYFSFGDKIDIETGILQSEFKRNAFDTDEIYLTNRIIGLQSIMFPKSSRAFLFDRFKSVPWYGMDIWFNHVFLEEYLPIGIVSKRLTTQLNGYSLVEKRYKEFV